MNNLPTPNAHRITDRLWLGNHLAARDEAFINSNNISLVVNCTKDIPYPTFYNKRVMKTFRIAIDDIDTSDNVGVLSSNMDRCLEAVRAAVKRGENVLVHCYAGVSRSATTMACYLVRYYSFRHDLAIIYIRSKRPVAFYPRPVFIEFLRGYEHTASS
jgi:dual specificity MAP kinase phosphatase